MSALAAPAPGSFLILQSKTAAASGDAIELNRLQLAEVLHFPARGRLLDEVQHLTLPSAAEEWFGPGAIGVTPVASHAAGLFLLNLPASFLDAEVSPDNDGGITIDWFRTPDSQLSITFDRQGRLYYAAVLGAIERVSGRMPFYGPIPEDIVRLLQRLAVSITPSLNR